MALSSFQVLKQVQIANAFVSYSAGLLMDKREMGIDCFDHQRRLNTLVSLIDSIKDYGTIYVNPNYKFSISSLVSGATIQFIGFLSDEQTITLDTYTFITSDATTAMNDFIDFVNDQNNGLTASLTGTATFPIKISAVNGSLSNNMPVSINTTGTITLALPVSIHFSTDGDDFFNRYSARCIPDNEVETILDKINSMIYLPCTDFVAF